MLIAADKGDSHPARDPVDIVAEDSGGQEYDPASDNSTYQEPEESKEGKPSQDSTDLEEVEEEDQGGQDFEPLPVKKILVD